MKRYRNLSGRSGVVAYAVAAAAITVEFRAGERYVYSHRSAGETAVNQMKLLAQEGRGLSSFIAQQKPPHEPR